jgi:hypothetical protein
MAAFNPARSAPVCPPDTTRRSLIPFLFLLANMTLPLGVAKVFLLRVLASTCSVAEPYSWVIALSAAHGLGLGSLGDWLKAAATLDARTGPHYCVNGKHGNVKYTVVDWVATETWYQVI